MTLAFLLFKYFPFGGAQRDCLKIASLCAARGHEVSIFCRTWQGDLPAGIQVQRLGEQGFTNVSKDRSFISAARERLLADPPDGVIGFNRMPGLDVYFCADSCWQAKIDESKRAWRRWLPRYRYLLEMEKAVFSRGQRTQILMLTPREIPLYQKYYGTEARFHVLPPGIARHRFSESERVAQREQVRGEFGWPQDTKLILFVGSGFRTKGLDRAVRATASLPLPLRANVHFAVVGQDSKRPYENLAQRLGIGSHVHFLGGRPDVQRFYQAADLLLHPAVKENTGTVLLEAVAAGLPVLATAACGYAPHVEKARAGIILAEPFAQARLDEALASALQAPERSAWQANALAYAASEDLYSQDERAVEIIEQVISSKISTRS